MTIEQGDKPMAYEKLHQNKSFYHKDYVNLQKYCFRGISDDQLRKEWEELTPEEGCVLGNIQKGELASVLTIFHHSISFYGHQVPMGGIGLVATSPYYREGGYCKKLIQEAIAYMDEQDILFSVLGPFDYSFYEQFGYKWAYRFYTYKVELEQLSHFKKSGKIKSALAVQKDVENLYLELCNQCNGMSVRTEKMWERKWQDESTMKVVYCNDQDEVDAYMFFNINERTFLIEELHYTSLNGFKNLLSFIYKHRAQADHLNIKAVYMLPLMNLLKNPYGEVKEEPFMMARIINVEKVLKKYHFSREGSLVMKVIDSQYQINDDTYVITIKNGEVSIQKGCNKASDMEINIAHLTQLILGFRKIEDLIATEEALMDKDVSEYFNHTRSTGLYDYF